MELKSKSYIVRKTYSLDFITSDIDRELYFNAYLIKKLDVKPIDSNNYEFTFFYTKYDLDPINCVVPDISTSVLSGSMSNDIRIIMNDRVLPTTVSSDCISVDNTNLTNVKLSQNNYFIQGNISAHTGAGYHSYKISNSNLKRYDDTILPYSVGGSYSISSSTSSRETTINFKPRGRLKLVRLNLEQRANSSQVITNYINQNNISLEYFIDSAIMDKDIFLLYVGYPEPQVIKSSILNNSIFYTNSAPSSVNITFSTILNSSVVTGTNGLLQVVNSYNTTTPINKSYISLLEDRQSINIILTGYAQNNGSYSIVVGTGIHSDRGIVKSKPELISFYIVPEVTIGSSNNSSTGGVDIATFTGHTGNNTIHYTQNQISIIASQISDFSGAISAFTSNLSGVSNIAFAAHTGDYNNPHLVTSVQIGAASTGSLSYLSGQLYAHTTSSNPHNVTLTGLTGVSVSTFTGHTGISAGAHGISSFGATLIDDTNASTARTTLQLAGLAIMNEDEISHLNIQDIGINSHATIDSHISNTNNPHSTTAAQLGAATTGNLAFVSGQLSNYTLTTLFTGHTGNYTNPHNVTAAQIGAASSTNLTYVSGQLTGLSSSFTSHTGNTLIHFTIANIDHNDIQGVGNYLHEDIDAHIDSTNNPHSVTTAQIGASSTGSYSYLSGLSRTHIDQTGNVHTVVAFQINASTGTWNNNLLGVTGDIQAALDAIDNLSLGGGSGLTQAEVLARSLGA